MIENNAALDPLIAARNRIDETIQGYLDKVAALRKRREAITTCMEVIRAGDDEIMQLPTVIHKSNGNRTNKVVQFDEDQVEGAVIALLLNSPVGMAFQNIHGCLEQDGIRHSMAGLRRILATCPRIMREGERDKTKYLIKS